MVSIDSLENLLSEVVRPIGNSLLHIVNHPIETASNILEFGAEAVKSHPYTCAAVIDLGAYACTAA